jgi:hypothetical protein
VSNTRALRKIFGSATMGEKGIQNTVQRWPHNLYSPNNTIRLIKSRRVNGGGGVSYLWWRREIREGFR